MNEVQGVLTINHLEKGFGKKRVLENLSFTFSNGVYGLLGPNGVGKTTFLRCLTMLYAVKEDMILYHGHPACKDRQYLSHVGYLPQKFGLFKELKVREMLHLLANLKGVDRNTAGDMIEECLALVNLSDRIDSPIKTLSGGMLRRLGIAQALLNRPDILIFDEPTAGLDPEERLRFKSLLSEIKRERIIVISTHIVEDVEAVCDTVAIMKDRRIAESGSCEQIRSHAEGKVFLLPQEEQKRIRGRYHIQKQFEKEGQIMLKILTSIPQELPSAVPTVEDGYICVLKGI